MSTEPQSSINTQPFLQGGGEMGQLMRNYDWAKTSLGTPDTWPQSLKTTISIILNSKFPMFLFWGPELICFYNDPYRPSLGNDGKHPRILGRPGVDAWQEIWAFIKPVIDNVLAGGDAELYEDQLLPIYRNNQLENVYWTFSYSSVSDGSGKPAGVFVTCMETTEKVRANEQLHISEQNLRNMVRQASVGMCIIKGQPLMVEEANDVFLEIIGKQREQFTDTPYWVVNAETAPYYEPITDKVMATGETYHANEHEIFLIRKGKPEIVHVDFVYQPIRNTAGTVDAIMIVAIDVTEKVVAQRLIEQNSEELAAMNEEIAASNEELISNNEEIAAASEELSATNEELAAVNEELGTTNEELIETQHDLERIIDDLALSETRFRSLVDQSPIGIAVFKGYDLLIEIVNGMMLQIWGKTTDIEGKPLAVAMPELVGQPFIGILQNVFTSGEPFYGNEAKAYVVRNGERVEGYQFYLSGYTRYERQYYQCFTGCNRDYPTG